MAEEMAVVAHGLLNSMSVVVAGLVTARTELGEVHRLEQLLVLAERQARFVADVLRDLALGLPAEVIQALNDIQRAHEQLDAQLEQKAQQSDF